jgi:hypothetical protein
MSTLKARMKPLRDECPDLPAELAAIVSGLLEPDPTKRIADAARLSRDLARMSAARGWRWRLPDPGRTAEAPSLPSAASDAPHAQVVDAIDSLEVLKD